MGQYDVVYSEFSYLQSRKGKALMPPTISTLGKYLRSFGDAFNLYHLVSNRIFENVVKEFSAATLCYLLSSLYLL